MTRSPDPDDFFRFADTATPDTQPDNDLEATYLRVQRAFAAPSASIAPSARRHIARTLESTAPTTRSHRVTPAWRHSLNTFQAAASFIAVLVIIGALFALAFGPNRTDLASQSPAIGLNDIYQIGPDTWEFRAGQCVTYGETPARQELLAMTSADFPSASYQVAERADESIGRELLQTFANMYYCNWTDVQGETAIGATPLMIDPLESNGTSYYSSRVLRGDILDELQEEERRDVLQFICYPPVELLEDSFPLQINRPAPMLNGIGAPIAVFDPTYVYRMKDDRYAAAISSLSLDDIVNPELRQYSVMIVFYVEQDGRYLVDQFVNIFNPPSYANPQGYRCT